MRSTEREAMEAVVDTTARARELTGEYLYSDEDKDYPQVVVELLEAKKLKLASAESCTGGLFAGAITSVPGSSEVYERGFVTYSNNAKMEMLGVSSDTLDKYGAVSDPCVREMAAGALEHSSADIAVAVTGIAGPGGASIDKPVGTVFFSLASSDGKCEVSEKHFRDRGRRVNRQVCVLELCDMIRRFLA
jgi:PncC family amidohydrolase